MRISIAQISSTIADFSGNVEKILAYTQKAKDGQKADLVLFPELAVSGFPPLDLANERRYAELNVEAVKKLKRELPSGIAAGLGYISWNPYLSRGRKRSSFGKRYVNVYGIILDGEIVFEQIKTFLPANDHFNEAKYFESAREWHAFEYMGERIGFAISEDFWQETDVCETTSAKNPIPQILEKGITMLCVPSALPYETDRYRLRLPLAAEISRAQELPIVFINAAGANDELVFDGRSFVFVPVPEKKKIAWDDESTLVLCAKAFEEDLALWDTSAFQKPGSIQKSVDVPGTEKIHIVKNRQHAESGVVSNSGVLLNFFGVDSPHYQMDMLELALVSGIREYMKKCGFSRAHLGLSGGIDSALVAYLAVKAAGQENVAAFSMPSRFSSQGSKDDAAELAANLGCRYETLPIENCYTAFLSTLEKVFENRPFDLAEENLQARIRGVLLMAYSNKFNSMLLTTGNKSETAMGYCTLYGDTNGALAPIGDLLKTEVFALCRRINERTVLEGRKAPIPAAIIDKPPSAELHPNQKDTDSLPPYETLDEILRLLLYENLPGSEIVIRGFGAELVNRIIKTMARTEFKRRQLPPAIKVSKHCFGMGHRIPIARSIYEI